MNFKNTIKISFFEKDDLNFINWVSFLLKYFIDKNLLRIVDINDNPDLLIASIWRKHPWINIPTILISNESWSNFNSFYPLSNYLAVLGIYHPLGDSYKTLPGENSLQGLNVNFISFPYDFVHFRSSYKNLMDIRNNLIMTPKNKFCCFVVSNPFLGSQSVYRYSVFSNLNKYKSVESAGAAFNNVGYLAPRGKEFFKWISNYKFMICLENSHHKSYISEKCFQAYISGTIPIYDFGNKDLFFKNALIDIFDHNYFEQIELLDSSPDLLKEKQNNILYKVEPSLNEFISNFENKVLHAYFL